MAEHISDMSFESIEEWCKESVKSDVSLVD